MENNQNKISRRNWTKEETLALLHAYSARKDEFLDIKKRKNAMANVLEDLIGQGVFTQPSSVEALNTKIKNLLRAWKSSRDNNKRTGSSPCFVPFEQLMEEIFGDRPTISNSHTINLCGVPTKALPVDIVSALEPSPSPTTNPEPISEHEESASSLEPVRRKKRQSAREMHFKEKLKLKKELGEKK